MAAEQTFNINFVQEVEKYPCLYNYMLPEYVRKDITKKAWIKIGKKFNLTGAECKEKWRNIRNVFVRNLKSGKSRTAAKKRKPYYLNEVMQFILPFIKLSTASVFGNLKTESVDEIIQPNDIDELTDDEEVSQPVQDNFLPTSSHTLPLYSVQMPSPSRPLLTPSPHSSSVSIPSPSPPSRPLPTPSPTSNFITKAKIRKPNNSVDESILYYFKAKQARIESSQAENPKKLFLLSLLPDIHPMSVGQMRKFKLGVMKLIDDILKDKPTTSSSIHD